MLHQSDDVVLAHVQERHRRLLAEADADRLARQLQPPALDRLLSALGMRLVQWGDRLQARGRRAQAAAHAAHFVYPLTQIGRTQS